jgi:serine/threonine-protein kinase RsbW
MQTNEPAVAHAHLKVHAEPAAVGAARRWITAFAGEYAMPASQQEDLAVAVSEAVTNVVRHAYPSDAAGDVVLAAATDGEWLSVQIKDRGCGNPSTSLGLGLPLMTELSDRVEVSAGRAGVGTVVLMEFPIDSVGREPSTRFVRAPEQPLGVPVCVPVGWSAHSRP